MFSINHYIPSLGSSSAGFSQVADSLVEALEIVENSLIHMSEDDKVVIEWVGEEVEKLDG